MSPQISATPERREREEILHRMENSEEAGAQVIAKVLRRAQAQQDEAVMWSQNWDAHSRSH